MFIIKALEIWKQIKIEAKTWRERMSEIDREKERQTDRQTDRQTKRERERERDR